MTAYIDYRVVAADDRLAVHCMTWCPERCRKWMDNVGAQLLPGREFVAQGLRADTKEWGDIEV